MSTYENDTRALETITKGQAIKMLDRITDAMKLQLPELLSPKDCSVISNLINDGVSSTTKTMLDRTSYREGLGELGTFSEYEEDICVSNYGELIIALSDYVRHTKKLQAHRDEILKTLSMLDVRIDDMDILMDHTMDRQRSLAENSEIPEV